MMPVLRSNSSFKLSDGCTTSTHNQTQVILDANTGEYYPLTGIAPFIVDRMQEGQSIERIYQTIQKNYKVNDRRCLRDLFRLIRIMMQAGLVEQK